MELFRQRGILELFRQCGILELFRQCGILELFRQCGILELFRQCGILVLFRQCDCLRLMYPMLPISLDCPFLIASSVFSNVYLKTILIVQDCVYYGDFLQLQNGNISSI